MLAFCEDGCKALAESDRSLNKSVLLNELGGCVVRLGGDGSTISCSCLRKSSCSCSDAKSSDVKSSSLKLSKRIIC